MPPYTGRTTNRAPVHLLRYRRPMQPQSKMQSSSGGWASTHDPSDHGAGAAIAADEVFVQTPAGALAAAGSTPGLPDRLRMLLFLVNGRRCMAEYRDLLPRYRDLDDAFGMLAKGGFIQRARDLAQH